MTKSVNKEIMLNNKWTNNRKTKKKNSVCMSEEIPPARELSAEHKGEKRHKHKQHANAHIIHGSPKDDTY